MVVWDIYYKQEIMKKLLLFLALALTDIVNAQLPYTWLTGVNPSWVSSNPSVNTLAFQTGCWQYVSTSDCIGNPSNWNTYNNSQVTTYLSPVYNFTCLSTFKVDVSVNINVNLETRYDWLYFLYSLDGGVTWINPVAQSASTNGSSVNLSAYPPLTTAGTNSNRNGWTGAVTVNQTYNITQSATMRFKFIFESDGSVNTYNSGNNIYYADIINVNASCSSILPIELVSFDGEKESCGQNVLLWKTASEINNEKFEIERSSDGITFIKIGEVLGKGTSSQMTNYLFRDTDVSPSINYYRLKQIDYNSDYTNSSIISIDNSCENSIKTLKITNLLGQEVDESYNGVIFIYRSDKTIIKRNQHAN